MNFAGNAMNYAGNVAYKVINDGGKVLHSMAKHSVKQIQKNKKHIKKFINNFSLSHIGNIAKYMANHLGYLVSDDNMKCVVDTIGDEANKYMTIANNMMREGPDAFGKAFVKSTSEWVGALKALDIGSDFQKSEACKWY